jgi:hypothetical protein
MKENVQEMETGHQHLRWLGIEVIIWKFMVE